MPGGWFTLYTGLPEETGFLQGTHLTYSMPPTSHHVTEPECAGMMRAVRDALDLIGGKWKLPIIVSLCAGPRRFKLLQRDMGDITAKMLSKELKDLEINGLVSRTVHTATAPITVEYALTPYGGSLFPVIQALAGWGQQHRARIMGPAGMVLAGAAG